MRKYKKLQDLLSLNYLTYAGKSTACGEKDLPALYCNTEVYPDFLALYGEPSLYHKTPSTAVCFYQFDKEFHKRDGLFEAIYYNDTKLLDYYKKRFANVKFFISPDYSIMGDIHLIENDHRLFRARIVALWFMFELNAVVIPNVSFAGKNGDFGIALDGLDNCSVIAISTKGHIQNAEEFETLKSNIPAMVDRLNLKAIVVYDVCGTDDKALDVFSYAVSKGIKIIIPDNTLKTRNTLLRKAVS